MAYADEPLRASAFLTSSGRTEWVKSYPSWGTALVLELGFPDEGITNVGLSIGSYVWPDLGSGPPKEIAAQVLAAEKLGSEIQVPVFELGWKHFLQFTGGGASLSISPEQRGMKAETGRPFHLMTIEGEDPIDVDLLLLPRRQDANPSMRDLGSEGPVP